eukprot:Lithocolla_globosa_v1_NODE_610_length_3609_cov_4.771525.p3 type:complete len:166 gc:universal NODE_610_length_3609_cov_4.771525:1676-2173(+)
MFAVELLEPFASFSAFFKLDLQLSHLTFLLDASKTTPQAKHLRLPLLNSSFAISTAIKSFSPALWTIGNRISTKLLIHSFPRSMYSGGVVNKLSVSSDVSGRGASGFSLGSLCKHVTTSMTITNTLVKISANKRPSRFSQDFLSTWLLSKTILTSPFDGGGKGSG